MEAEAKEEKKLSLSNVGLPVVARSRRPEEWE